MLAYTLKYSRTAVRIYPMPRHPDILYALESTSKLLEMAIENRLDAYIEARRGR